MENEMNSEAMYQLAIQENSELRHALRALTVKNAELEQQLQEKDANKKETNKKAN